MKSKQKFVELHLHLDGAITVPIARKLAVMQNIKLAENQYITDDELEKKLSVSKDCHSLDDFLKCFELPLSLMQTREGIREAVYLVQENLLSQNIVYAELRFAPLLHCDKGLDQEEVILAALDGLKLSKLRCNFILCCMRGSDNAANMETVELAKKYFVNNGGVTALDLAGAEAIFPTEDYEEIFTKAKEYNIPFTIHAGEAAGAESVKKAIDFGAKRIGHGVRSFENKELLQEILEEGIVLEMCPTSNRQTKAIMDMAQYPIKKYMNMGIKVTINTDDMAICRTTLSEEFDYIENKFGLSENEKRGLVMNAISAAFTDKETKREIKKLI